MLKQGLLRAEKVEYPDGIGCSIWRIFPGGDENIGQCWDFAFDELDDIMSLLERLKSEPVEIYSEDE